MKRFETRNLMIKYLMDFVGPYGYKEKLVNVSDFEFVRQTITGKDFIFGGITNYDPVQMIDYNLGKQNKQILKILIEFQKTGVKFNPPVNKDTGVLGFSYESLNGISSNRYLPEISTESDVKLCVDMMIDFMKRVAFPILEKFEDLREIDKLVNEKDMWKSDWGMQYNLGGNFHIKRLLVSKLAGLGNYSKTLDFIKSDYSSQLNGEYGQAYKKALEDVERLDIFIQDIKPLY